MSPQELIYFSLQCAVEIEPSKHIAAADFVTFRFQGCHPLIPTIVPLFVALHLRSLNCCRIRPLSYLAFDFITELVEKEEAQAGEFVELPEFFFEHASIFMTEQIESLVSELKSLRMAKLWKGMQSINGKPVKVTGLTRWEFNEIKPAVIEALRFGKKLEHSAFA